MEKIIPLIVSLIDVLAWPSVILIIVFLFRNTLNNLLSRAEKVDLKSDGVALVLSKMKEIEPKLQKEFSDLSVTDIWFISDIESGSVKGELKNMNPAQKVAAVSLLKTGLIRKENVKDKKHIVVTPLGKHFLEIANNIF